MTARPPDANPDAEFDGQFDRLALSRDLRERLADWVRQLRDEKRLSHHSLAAYSRDMRQFLEFIEENQSSQIDTELFGSVKLSTLRGFMAARRAQGTSSRSLNRSLSALRNFTVFLHRCELPVSQAFELINPPSSKTSLPRPVAADDALRLIELALTGAKLPWIGLRDSALLCLLYGTGLRISEALSLTRQDIAAKAAKRGDIVLRITGKGGKIRHVPLLPMIDRALTDYLAALPFSISATEPLFRGQRGGVLSARQAQLMLAALRRQLNLPDTVTPHALRHSFASHLLAAGGDLRTIQELLGHAQLSSTQIYTQIDSNQLMEVYEKAHPRAK